MTDPDRWSESHDAPPEVLELLKHARSPEPLGAEAFRRSRQRIAALGALPIAVGSLFWLPQLALGAALGAAASAATLVPELIAPPAPPASVESARVGAAPRVRSLPAPRRSAEIAAPLAPEAPLETASSPVAEVPGGAPPPLGSAERLRREAALLETARGLLRTDAAAALAALERHAREHPHGALGVEREFLAIDALLRLGRRPEAEQRAARFRGLGGASLYDQRLERMLRRASTPNSP